MSSTQPLRPAEISAEEGVAKRTLKSTPATMSGFGAIAPSSHEATIF